MTEKSAPASLGRSLKAVAWGFFGIRKGSEYQQDLASVNPLHIVLVAIGGVGIFVVTLMFFVKWVVSK